MEQLDSLLQLVTQLQNEADTASSRRLLLAHARVSSGARLALLLRLDDKRQHLVLLARDGRRPAHAAKQPVPAHISLQGYFGAALLAKSLLSIPDLHAEPRALAEERYWTWPHGPVITCAIGHSALLVLCFTPATGQTDGDIDESAILICASLLSNYLGRDRFIASASRRMSASLTPIHAPTPSIAHGNVMANKVENTDAWRDADAMNRSLPGISAEVERERERIARDMHDGPAQQFASVLHRLEYVERILLRQPQDALREIGRARTMLDTGLRELRQSIATLIPTRLQEQTFPDALYALADDYAPLPITLELETHASMPPALEVPIYRFVQEALNNTRKHAQATGATVRLRMLPGLMLVEVSDDGKGFDNDILLRTGKTTGQHLGLRAMRERVHEAGGTVEITGKVGVGTMVRARFPLTGDVSSHTSAPVSTLTDREREVLHLVIDGLTNRAIAEQLSVSIETVKSHLHHIMQKLNAKDRTQAAVLATKQRWL